MIEVLFLFLSISFAVGDTGPEVENKPEDCGFNFGGKIVGGMPVNIEQYPYQLSLEYRGRHACGAVLIGHKWALTAAHCTDLMQAQFLTVRAGSSSHQRGGQQVAVKTVYQHKGYSSKFEIDYDISVLELEAPITHKNARPIPLAEADAVIAEGTCGVITGWGVTTEGGFVSRGLRMVVVPVVNISKCRAAYGVSTITDRMFCAGAIAGGKDACQGDSGGPFAINGVLTGIVSWGIGCARAGFPGVYTSIPALREFIRSVSGI